MKEREHDTHPLFPFLRPAAKAARLLCLEALIFSVFSPSQAGLYSDFEHTFAAEAQAFEN
jgi:hypothetical protein